MESRKPDNCHLEVITCQALWVPWLTEAYYPYRIKTWHSPHVYQRWFNWDDLTRNPICICFSSTGWGPWKARVKIPRAASHLNCSNIGEAQGVRQNRMYNQTQTWLVWIYVARKRPLVAFPCKEKGVCLALWVWYRGDGTRLQESLRKEAECWGESCLEKGLVEGFPVSSFLIVYGAPYCILDVVKNQEGGRGDVSQSIWESLDMNSLTQGVSSNIVPLSAVVV